MCFPAVALASVTNCLAVWGAYSAKRLLTNATTGTRRRRTRMARAAVRHRATRPGRYYRDGAASGGGGVAFSNTPGGGAYVVAGAILIGSGMIAVALASGRGGDGD